MQCHPDFDLVIRENTELNELLQEQMRIGGLSDCALQWYPAGGVAYDH